MNPLRKMLPGASPMERRMMASVLEHERMTGDLD
jgi:hypothetical protein